MPHPSVAVVFDIGWLAATALHLWVHNSCSKPINDDIVGWNVYLKFSWLTCLLYIILIVLNELFKYMNEQINLWFWWRRWCWGQKQRHIETKNRRWDLLVPKCLHNDIWHQQTSQCIFTAKLSSQPHLLAVPYPLLRNTLTVSDKFSRKLFN